MFAPVAFSFIAVLILACGLAFFLLLSLLDSRGLLSRPALLPALETEEGESLDPEVRRWPQKPLKPAYKRGGRRGASQHLITLPILRCLPARPRRTRPVQADGRGALLPHHHLHRHRYDSANHSDASDDNDDGVAALELAAKGDHRV